MLFDVIPKTRKRDLFGREAELDELLRALDTGAPVTLLLGVRRIGKTSLLKTALSVSKKRWIYVDSRRLEEEGYSKDVLYRILSEEFTKLLSSWGRVRDALKRVRGVHIAEAGVEFDVSQDRAMLSSVFASLDRLAGKDQGLIVAVDEAQLLRNMRGGKGRLDLRSLIAYCYDNLPNIKFILTGSEVGLLYDFLGPDDPKSPLYGRAVDEIRLNRFDREKSLAFLEKGFKEYDVKVERESLEEAVEKLDGIVGWLSLFGYRKTQKKREVMASILEVAKGMARGELAPLLARSRYYGLVLRSMASGSATWTEIRVATSVLAKKRVTNAEVTRILESLVRLSIIEKQEDRYEIIDPIITELAKSP